MKTLQERLRHARLNTYVDMLAASAEAADALDAARAEIEQLTKDAKLFLNNWGSAARINNALNAELTALKAKAAKDAADAARYRRLMKHGYAWVADAFGIAYGFNTPTSEIVDTISARLDEGIKGETK